MLDRVFPGESLGDANRFPVMVFLRYKPVNVANANYRYEDTGNVTRYTVTGLDLGTEYVFSIQAANRLGSSRYLADTLRATTSSELILLLISFDFVIFFYVH